MQLKSIYNYVQFNHSIATSGQPTENEFKLIANNNYKIIINLAMHNSNNALDNEDYLISSLNMSYFHIPVDFTNPTQHQLQIFLKLMEQFSQQKIWVHCAANYRVSAFMQHLIQVNPILERNYEISPIFNQWKMDRAWENFLKLKVK